MFCSAHTRSAFLILALIISCVLAGSAFAQDSAGSLPAQTIVHLRWGARPGVSRYRLQLARDRAFADIVFDRVVRGTELEINDLDPGFYFWRVAPLSSALGEFSSAGAIEVKAVPIQTSPTPAPNPSPVSLRSNSVEAGGGWRAALGSINQTIGARLRAPFRADIVTLNAGGVVYALDSTNGVALWTVRTSESATARFALSRILLAVPNRLRLDNIVIINGALVRNIEGTTGRELWRATLPAPASAASVIEDHSEARVVIIDNSRRRLFIVREANGELTAQTDLPARVVGAPVTMSGEGNRAFALSFDNGDLQTRDAAGALLRRVNVSSPATTPPLFVRGRRGDLLLVGTREGLNALTADELRPLGRVTIPDDAPRGTLLAQDLDNDGVAEIIMTTERRHLVVVNSTDGKILWNIRASEYGESLAFADVDGDQFSDVFVDAGQRFAIALSGRDGSVLWTGESEALPATNHATSFESRGLIAVRSNGGLLLIGRDVSQAGLRAVTFFKTAVRPNSR